MSLKKARMRFSWSRKLLGICLLLTLALLPLWSPSGTALAADSPAKVSLLVKFLAGSTADERAAVIAGADGVQTAVIAPLRLHTVDVPVANLDLTIADLASDPLVERVELNQARKVEGLPADADYSLQWALSKIGWEEVYGTLAPSGSAVVALLDTGVNAAHPDLTGKVLPGTSLFDSSNGQSDLNGHGTAMAGIIAASTGNGIGVAGVAFDGVKILPVTVLDAAGLGQDSDVIAGILYAVEQQADVIVMGFSNPGQSLSLQEAIDYAWEEGLVLVSATGNDGSTDPTYPAGSPGVVGVSATDQDDALVPSSNYGQAAFLAAPGIGIYTTSADNAYSDFSGTSAAAAIVGGAAGLMKAMDATLDNGIIVGRLAATADAAGTVEQTGNGRINLARAIADASGESVRPAGAPGGGPFVGPYVAAARNLTISINGTGSGTVSITPASGTTASPSSGSTTFTSSINPNAGTGTLTATADAGSTFAGWSSPTTGITCNPLTSTTCTFSMGNRVQSVTATFTAALQTPTVAVSNSPKTYTGSPIAATVTCSSGGAVSDIKYAGSSSAPTDAGTYAVTADCAATGNYTALNDASAGNFVIDPAATTTTVTCPTTVTHTGSAQEPCDAAVTGPGLNQTLTVSYSDNINVGTATASASYAGAGNYAESSDSENYEITAPLQTPTVAVSNSPQTYTGSPIAATVTCSSGGAVTDIKYNGSTTAPTDADTYAVTADCAATGNYTALNDASAGDFVIDPAATTTTVTCPVEVTHTGSAQEPCSATVTGPELNQGLTVTYSNNINVGTATANASYAGTGNYAESSDSESFEILAEPVYNVPAGTDVVVDPSAAVKVTFGEVTQAGNLTATVLNNPVPPANFRVITGASFDITNTAVFAGPVTVCLDYSDAALVDQNNEANIKLFHHNGQNWEDITTSVDTVNNRVCGVTYSFSPFALAEPVSKSYTITASAGSNGSIDPAGDVIVPQYGSQNFTFTPDPGYKVSYFSVNGINRGSDSTYTLSNVKMNQTIAVYFTKLTYTITASATTGGTISYLGDKVYTHGSTPSYAITPAAGYTIEDVLVDGQSVGKVTSYTFPALDAGHTIEAVFAANQGWLISVSATGSGTVSPAGNMTVLEGASQKFTFNPAAGYKIGSLVVDGVSKVIASSWTFSKVSKDHTLAVTFVPDVFTITASAGSNGSIDPVGVTDVPRNDTQTYTFMPNEGYKVSYFTVNGISKGYAESYTFTNVKANQKIAVYFTKVP